MAIKQYDLITVLQLLREAGVPKAKEINPLEVAVMVSSIQYTDLSQLVRVQKSDIPIKVGDKSYKAVVLKPTEE